MSTVVGDVSVNVPLPLPLKGADCVAKVAGNALRMVSRPITVIIRSFMASTEIPWCLYKDSSSGASSGYLYTRCLPAQAPTH